VASTDHTPTLALTEEDTNMNTSHDDFFIYENWQAGPHKAVIHQTDCGFCNAGRGLRGGYDLRHARWHPEPGRGLPSLEQARAYARAIPGVLIYIEHRCV
jgi:hypothetical protein